MAKDRGDKVSSPPSVVEVRDAVEGKENLEKVRDLLFGTQLRTFDGKVNRLEERLLREIGDLKDEVRRRMDALELFMKDEFKTVAGRITNEQDKRSDAVKQLNSEIRRTVEAFEEKVSQVENRLEETGKELREQILAQSKQLNEDLMRKHNEAIGFMQKSADQIRVEHVSRSSLSRMFTELAVGLDTALARDILPGHEDVGNE